MQCYEMKLARTENLLRIMTKCLKEVALEIFLDLIFQFHSENSTSCGMSELDPDR